MSRSKTTIRSLRWRFTLGFITLQLATIAASFGLVLYIATLSTPGGAVPSVWLSQEISHSITVDDAGKIALVPTPSLVTMMREWPTMWFVAYLPDGSTLRQGTVPEDIAQSIPFLSTFRSVELRGSLDTPDRQARVDRLQTDAGEVTILAGGVSMSVYRLTFLLGQIAIGVPAFILVTITILGVPWITRWALRSLSDLSNRLNKIDFDARGGVVDEQGLPAELLRVVREINLVLQRLDAGFEKTERFFVNAAHELRTPIAVLQVRADTLPASDEKLHLQRGIKRLTAITNQLLEIERYRQSVPQVRRFELTRTLAKVVADLAPFAIAQGYDISFDTEAQEVVMEGDQEAIERAFSNLVRNAVQYGGNSGDIIVRLDADGSVFVTDEGGGIPSELLPRIFEPFYRINPHGLGAGLGLSMVSEIIERHNGYVEVESSPGTGSQFAVRWRDAPARNGRVVIL